MVAGLAIFPVAASHSRARQKYTIVCKRLTEPRLIAQASAWRKRYETSPRLGDGHARLGIRPDDKSRGGLGRLRRPKSQQWLRPVLEQCRCEPDQQSRSPGGIHSWGGEMRTLPCGRSIRDDGSGAGHGNPAGTRLPARHPELRPEIPVLRRRLERRLRCLSDPQLRFAERRMQRAPCRRTPQPALQRQSHDAGGGSLPDHLPAVAGPSCDTGLERDPKRADRHPRARSNHPEHSELVAGSTRSKTTRSEPSALPGRARPRSRIRSPRHHPTRTGRRSFVVSDVAPGSRAGGSRINPVPPAAPRREGLRRAALPGRLRRRAGSSRTRRPTRWRPSPGLWRRRVRDHRIDARRR